MTKEEKIKELMELVLSLSTNSLAYQAKMVGEDKVEELFEAIESKLRELIQ